MQTHVWQLAMEVCATVNKLASRLPSTERYELASQLRRAAASIPSNIAEGSVGTTRVYINHLRIALGSEAELKTQLHLAVRLRYVDEAEVADVLSRISEVGRMLRGLMKSLARRL